MNPNLLKVLYKRPAKWAVRLSLTGQYRDPLRHDKGRLSRAEVDAMLDQAWCYYDKLALELPREPSAGNRTNMMFACLTLSVFKAMLAMGVERGYAIELASSAVGKVSEWVGAWPNSIARLLTRDPNRRLRTAAGLFKGYPFNTPGYTYESVPTNEGVFFEIFRCPLAEYLREHDAADLCVSAWCSQGDRLAEAWSGRLERKGTIAGGHDRCDFHFKATRGADRLVSKPVSVSREGEETG